MAAYMGGGCMGEQAAVSVQASALSSDATGGTAAGM